MISEEISMLILNYMENENLTELERLIQNKNILNDTIYINELNQSDPLFGIRIAMLIKNASLNNHKIDLVNDKILNLLLKNGIDVNIMSVDQNETIPILRLLLGLVGNKLITEAECLKMINKLIKYGMDYTQINEDVIQRIEKFIVDGNINFAMTLISILLKHKILHFEQLTNLTKKIFSENFGGIAQLVFRFGKRHNKRKRHSKRKKSKKSKYFSKN